MPLTRVGAAETAIADVEPILHPALGGGGGGAAETLTVTCACPAAPRLSVATARITCVPAARPLMLQLSKGACSSVPTSVPSTYQSTWRMPSASVALTRHVTGPEVTVAPFTGCTKLTTGGGFVAVPLLILTLRAAVAETLAAS